MCYHALERPLFADWSEEEQDMAHIKRITVTKASDAFVDAFFEIWMSVMMFILTGAFGKAR